MSWWVERRERGREGGREGEREEGEKGGGRDGEIGKEGMRLRLLQVSVSTVALIILTSDVLLCLFVCLFVCLFISGSLCSLESIVRRVKTYWRK